MAGDLEDYVDIESMAAGIGKTPLEQTFASIDDNNADYVSKFLKQDVEEYIAEHVSQELQGMTSVLRSVRQEAAALKIEGVLTDHEAMSNFVPEIAPTDAKGMSAEEASAAKAVASQVLACVPGELRHRHGRLS